MSKPVDLDALREHARESCLQTPRARTIDFAVGTATLLTAAADELASLRSSVAQLEAELALARAVAEAAWDSPGKHYNAQLMLALAAWRGGSNG